MSKHKINGESPKGKLWTHSEIAKIISETEANVFNIEDFEAEGWFTFARLREICKEQGSPVGYKKLRDRLDQRRKAGQLEERRERFIHKSTGGGYLAKIYRLKV